MGRHVDYGCRHALLVVTERVLYLGEPRDGQEMQPGSALTAPLCGRVGRREGVKLREAEALSYKPLAQGSCRYTSYSGRAERTPAILYI
jgi:hypothetical protein